MTFHTKTTEGDYKAKLAKVRPDLTLIGPFNGLRVHSLHRCRCGNEWNVFPSRALNEPIRCKACSPQRQPLRITTQEFRRRLKSIHGSSISLVGNYRSMACEVSLRCSCGNSWKARAGNLIHRASGCPSCALKLKTITLNGVNVKVQGYEDLAVDWLLAHGTSECDIKVFSTGGVPIIPYTFQGKQTFHKPDIYVEQKHTLYEVKSVSTFGLVPCKYHHSGRTLFYRLCSKAKAAKRLGYRYIVLLMKEDGSRIYLPRGWKDMTYRMIKSAVAV